MKNVIYSLFFCAAMWFLLSNASGVPQAVTKAPGEANHNSCASCHIPAGNFNTSIQLDILNSDSIPVSHYMPGQTYTLRLKVSGSNNPKAYGFQMACLDSLTNSDFGAWSVLGDKVKQQNLTVAGKQRKYLVQSAPKTNGIFMANWKAPSSDVGKIKFYFTGLAINQNGNTNGDSNTFGSKALPGLLSSIYTANIQPDLNLFPNPMTDFVSVSENQVYSVQFTNLAGLQINKLCSPDKKMDVSDLPPGLYIAHGKSQGGKVIWTTRAMKQ